MALQKPVFGDQPWKGPTGWGAVNAVDGRYTDRSADGGQCVISDNYRYRATWWVDLGGVVSISHINIYYRTENKPSMIYEALPTLLVYVYMKMLLTVI